MWTQETQETYMHVLGLLFANIAAAKITIKHHLFTLCLSAFNLPAQLLLCVNKLLLTSTRQQA